MLMTIDLKMTAVLVICFTVVQSSQPMMKFVLTIEAGSTHIKAILFKSPKDRPEQIVQIKSCKVKSEIAHYAGVKIKQAWNKLVRCIEQMLKGVVEQDIVDVSVVVTSDIRVIQLKDPSAFKLMMSEMKQKLSDIKLNVKRVNIIKGTDERLLSWLGANYHVGLLKSNSENKFIDVVDMRDASTHLTLGAQQTEHKQNQKVNFYGKNFSVVTFGNQCFGYEQGFLRYLNMMIHSHVKLKPNDTIILVACMPKGAETSAKRFLFENGCTRRKGVNRVINGNFTLIGTSDVEKCLEEIGDLLNINQCRKTYKLCFKGPQQQSPPLPTSNQKANKVLVVSALEHLSNKPKQKNNTNTHQYITAEQYLKQSKELCNKTKTELNQKFKQIPKYIRNKYCFQLLYNLRILTLVYGFNRKAWSKLRFINSIQTNGPHWATGLTIMGQNILTELKYHSKLYALIVMGISILFVICGIISLWRLRT